MRSGKEIPYWEDCTPYLTDFLGEATVLLEPNARFQPPLEAGATQERTLYAVGSKPLLGGGSLRQPWFKR
jgi:hypothetical protein